MRLQKILKEVLVISLIVLGWWWIEKPDGNLHVVFCDVGQGDAILIIKEDVQMLVDAGPGSAVMECLDGNMPFWDRKIEVVVNTHPDRDHIGGLDKVMNEFEVGKLVINGMRGENEDSQEVLELVKERGVEVVIPKAGDRIVMGEMEFDVWWPEDKQGEVMAWRDMGYGVGEEEEDMNKMSVVGLLSWNDFEVLLTGDIGQEEELALKRSGVLRNVDVLKVSHHGSKFSSDEKFLEVVRPKEAVIMVGEKNSFGHPTDEVLMRLDQVGSRVWRTDEQGEIEIVSDGLGYWVEKP